MKLIIDGSNVSRIQYGPLDYEIASPRRLDDVVLSDCLRSGAKDHVDDTVIAVREHGSWKPCKGYHNLESIIARLWYFENGWTQKPEIEYSEPIENPESKISTVTVRFGGARTTSYYIFIFTGCVWRFSEKLMKRFDLPFDADLSAGMRTLSQAKSTIDCLERTLLDEKRHPNEEG